MNDDHLLRAPWTVEEVRALNRFQQTPHVHPMTCPNNHRDRVLIAHTDGWHCPMCKYRQSWAQRVMLNEPPKPLPIISGG